MIKKEIQKLGTVDLDMMEATPFVYQGRLHIFEYIHEFYHANTSGTTYFRIVEVASGKILSDFAPGYALGSLYCWQDRFYVTGVRNAADPKTGKNRDIFCWTSDDLIHWSEPRVILHGDDFQIYNTSICRAEDRFVMVFELGEPEYLVGKPFTMFFAESQDLEHWKILEGCSFGKEIYTGAPLLRYFDGYFYFFFLHQVDPQKEYFETYVVRSHDLKQWEWAERNPVLVPSPAERRRAENAAYPHDLENERVQNGVDINNSDLDFCTFQGKTFLTYSWGNQFYKDNLAVAEFPGDERDFCLHFFQSPEA